MGGGGGSDGFFSVENDDHHLWDHFVHCGSWRMISSS
jgi:hypothetical protein